MRTRNEMCEKCVNPATLRCRDARPERYGRDDSLRSRRSRSLYYRLSVSPEPPHRAPTKRTLQQISERDSLLPSRARLCPVGDNWPTSSRRISVNPLVCVRRTVPLRHSTTPSVQAIFTPYGDFAGNHFPSPGMNYFLSRLGGVSSINSG